MKNQLTVFRNEKFGEVRVVMIDNEPWFVGKDVCDILGYQNGSRDINRHVDDDDRQNYQNGTLETNRGMTIINESGLYSLILTSKLPQAKAFKHWVTSEVLPSIRKNGYYGEPSPELLKAMENMCSTMVNCCNSINKVCSNLVEASEFLNGNINSMTNEPLYEDLFILSDVNWEEKFYEYGKNWISMSDLAEILKDYVEGIGRNKLFQFLRGEGIFVRRLAKDEYIDLGYFRVFVKEGINKSGTKYRNEQIQISRIGAAFIHGVIIRKMN